MQTLKTTLAGKWMIVCLAAAISAAAGAAQATSLDWAGTASGYYHQNTSAYFDPNGTGTTITGTFDVTNLNNGGVEMFGLIDKKLKDQGGYMWQSGVYIYVYKTTNGVLVGTSDGNLGGEITSNASNVGTVNSIDFVMYVHSNTITLTSSLFSQKSGTYGAVKTLNNAYGYAWDEFAEGAYLGGCLWAETGASVGFDVSASPVVPEPATLGLLLLGLPLLRRRR